LPTGFPVIIVDLNKNACILLFIRVIDLEEEKYINTLTYLYKKKFKIII
jgi:hypothetical protein